MSAYRGFVSVNCAPPGVSWIGIYDSGGVRRGRIKLPSRMLSPSGEKKYSFGCVSDAHTFTNASYVDDKTANDDLTRALSFFSKNADFTCICGDFTCHGSDAELTHYKSLADASCGGKEVFAMAGNHESIFSTVTDSALMAATGHPRLYTHEHGNDIFIMCGCSSNSVQFTTDDLTWLQEVLEENRNRRCFLFVHAFLRGADYCGDCTELYTFDMLSGAAGETFKSLLSHYKNVIYFHGHSHELFEMQEYCRSLPGKPPCCYDNALGCHSVHIPSLAIPIDVSSGERVIVSGESQGYLVDVYDDAVLLRGRDFVRGVWLPYAIYRLDTPLVNVEAGSWRNPA